jgi:hypothetical protein
MALRNVKPRGTLERSAGADLFRHTLSRIPSHFGRLMYLSSLRDPNAGTYRHFGLASAFGRDQAAKALAASHTRAFADWLTQSLPEKHADVVEYLNTLTDPNCVVVAYWLETEGFAGGVPDTATDAERALYLSDIRRLLTLINKQESARTPAAAMDSNAVAS